MFFAAESRYWGSRDLHSMQMLQNRMVRGALSQKIRKMHDDKVTMTDVGRRLCLDTSR